MFHGPKILVFVNQCLSFPGHFRSVKTDVLIKNYDNYSFMNSYLPIVVLTLSLPNLFIEHILFIIILFLGQFSRAINTRIYSEKIPPKDFRFEFNL